jgi:hypothetical protein
MRMIKGAFFPERLSAELHGTIFPAGEANKWKTWIPGAVIFCALAATP